MGKDIERFLFFEGRLSLYIKGESDIMGLVNLTCWSEYYTERINMEIWESLEHPFSQGPMDSYKDW